MKMTDLRAKARAIFGNAIAEPMPNQPNGAKALQQRANARPIPTYKVGGVVKKNDGGLLKKPIRGKKISVPLEDEKLQTRRDFAKPLPKKQPKVVDFEPRQPKTGRAPANAPKPPEMTRSPDITVRGTPPTKPGREEAMMEARRAAQAAQAARRSPEADDVLMTTRRGQQIMDDQKRREMRMEEARRKKQAAADKMLGVTMKKGGKVARYKDGSGYRAGFEPRAGESDAERLKRETEFLKAKAAAEGARSRQQRAEDEKIGFNYQKPVAPKEGYRRGFEPRAGESDAERLKRELEFLKAKAARKKDGGKVQTSSDTARKLATEMGGMKKGGKAKDGLAVMIAIGKPMKKPVKKAVGGAGKTRKGMAPIKKAQGGAAKVRKGMMSESGDMLQPIKPKAGLGDTY